jgi:GYF domain 2
MDDDSRAIDKGWDTLPEYGNKSGDADEAVTVSISTTPGEWLVNTVDAVVVPMSMAELVEGLRSHKLTERSLVWRAGMQEWATVDRVPQLKLAARMPSAGTLSAAPPRPTPAPVATATPSKPPPKPVRATPAPQSTPPQFATARSTSPQSVPSRKATLPFGLQTPVATPSRPGQLRPQSSPRAALPPPASKDEPEVLAVYDRPAATISFDLSPVQPLRTAARAPTPPPQTLAPTTTDSTQRRAPVPRNADLSVVAASQFREVQRSSKRLVWVSSLASAAAASLLTFWASRGAPPSPTPVVEPAPMAAARQVAMAALPPAPLHSPTEPSPEPSAAPAESATAAPSAVASKPKSARKAKAVSAVPSPRPVRAEGDQGAATRDPSAEPNPYDVKLEEDPPTAKAAPVAARGSGLEPDSKPTEAANGSSSPGF